MPAPAETSSAEEREPERQTEPKGELVPPRRRPPTAVAAETPPPPQEPVHLTPRRVPAPRAPALSQFLDALRAVAGTMLDIADAAAAALTKRWAG
jgi:hypothetical protein